MSARPTSPPRDPNQAINAHALVLSGVTALSAVGAAVATGLSTALGAFDGEPVVIVIAAFAVIALAMAVSAHVFVTDLRVHSRQTLSDDCLRYLAEGHQVQPVPDDRT